MIKVTDSGCGIHQEILSRLKRAFAKKEREDFMNEEGFGSSIIKKTIDAFKGTIKIDSLVNIGTEVSLTIPEKKPSSILDSS